MAGSDAQADKINRPTPAKEIATDAKAGENIPAVFDLAKLSNSKINTPPPLTRSNILTLQRSIGNKAVQRLLKRQKTPPALPATLVQRYTEEDLKLRAYVIWESKGKPEGKDAENHTEAKAELDRVEAAILNRAKAIWEANGKKPGEDEKNYLQAKTEIEAQIGKLAGGIWKTKLGGGGNQDVVGANNDRRMAEAKLFPEPVPPPPPGTLPPGMPEAPTMTGTIVHPALADGDGGPGQPKKEIVVKELQQKLRASGAMVKDPPNADKELAVTGLYDPDTKKAIKDFKASFGLPDNDTLDNATWDKLDALGSSTGGRVEKQWRERLGGKEYGLTSKYDWKIEPNRLVISTKIFFEKVGVPGPDAVINTVFAGIRTVWNNRFKIVPDKTPIPTGPGLEYAIFFDIAESATPAEQDMKVKLKAGAGRSDAGNWYVVDADLGPKTAPHEFGHMISLEDEYQRSHADYQRLTGRDPDPLGGPNPLTVDPAVAANELGTRLAAGTNAGNAGAALVSALDYLQSVGLYNQPGAGQAVDQAYAAAHAGTSINNEISRVAGLLPIAQMLNWTANGGAWTTQNVDTTRSSLVSPFTFKSQSLMGGMGNVDPAHQHGLEARHARHFVKFIEQYRGGKWKVEMV